MFEVNNPKYIIQVLNILADLAEDTSKTRVAILRSGSDGIIKLIAETARNFLDKRLPVTQYYKTRLREHAGVIRSLASPRYKLRRRRRLCVQNPEVIGLLLKAVLNDLISILSLDTK